MKKQVTEITLENDGDAMSIKADGEHIELHVSPDFYISKDDLPDLIEALKEIAGEIES